MLIRRWPYLLLSLTLLAGCKDRAAEQAQKNALVERALHNLVSIDGGRFEMGGFNVNFTAVPQDNLPVHWVSLSDFRMSQYRITWGEFNQWSDLLGRGRNEYYKKVISRYERADRSGYSIKLKKFTGDDYPAQVTWQEAKDYCQWLGQQSGRAIDLPTEAQWEYAARSGGHKILGGNSDNRYYTDDEAYDEDDGHYFDADLQTFLPYGDGELKINPKFMRNFADTIEPVGRYAPNPLGLYDMMGNGKDWINDWYAEDYYAHSPEQDPQGPATGSKKVARGQFRVSSFGYKVLERSKQKPDAVDTEYVFRCVENSPLRALPAD
jgi:formylglycine-generating enzyme